MSNVMEIGKQLVDLCKAGAGRLDVSAEHHPGGKTFLSDADEVGGDRMALLKQRALAQQSAISHVKIGNARHHAQAHRFGVAGGRAMLT